MSLELLSCALIFCDVISTVGTPVVVWLAYMRIQLLLDDGAAAIDRAKDLSIPISHLCRYSLIHYNNL